MIYFKQIFIFLVCCTISVSLFAQGIVVSGTVTDGEGGILPGVNVVVKGTIIGTVCDSNGRYSIAVPNENAVLQFSFMGFLTQEVMVGSRRVIDVNLIEDTQQIEEVVVVGYGTLRKSDVTGSIAVVSGDDLNRTSSFSALDGLRGVASGVNVFNTSGMPGADIRVVIRGQSSINARSEPLYVVDGVVMTNFQYSSPDDIERIEVLKDASSTAIYGARGAQGVILVTTKSGLKGDGTRITYSGRVGVATLMRRMETLNSEEYLRAYREGMRNYVAYGSGTGASATVESRTEAMDLRWTNIARNSKSDLNNGNYYPLFRINGAFNPRGWMNEFDTNLEPLYDTDWQDESTHNAIQQSHSLTIQQGGKNSSAAAFLNYADEQGIMLNTYIKRINARVTYSANPKPWLSTDVSLRLNHSWQNQTTGGGGMVAYRMMIEMPPIFPVKYDDGVWANTGTGVNGFGFESAANPTHFLTVRETMRYRTQMFGTAALTFHLADGLDFRTSFGMDGTLNRDKNYQPVGVMNADNNGMGQADMSLNEGSYWQQVNYLTYRKVSNQHRFNGTLGLEWSERVTRSNYAEARGFATNAFGFDNMGSGTIRQSITSSHNRWAMNSYFGRFSYTLSDKYSFMFTGRVDGSSRFGANNKYAFFPSAGVNWIMSSEEFMQGMTWIDNLKLHTSYGVTGNTEINVYQSLSTFSLGTTLLNNGLQPSANPSRMANPDLRWEKTTQWDIGFDLNTFKNRLNFDISYYYKYTSDLILSANIPISSGFGSIMKNVGALSNRGWDIMVTGLPVASRDFDWTVSLNANYNTNKVEKLNEDGSDMFVGDNWVGARMILRVGEPVAQYYGLERIGIKSPEYVAVNGGRVGTALRSDELKPLGKGMPDWTGSFMNRFRYKGVDFTAELTFTIGGTFRQDYYHSAEDRFGLTSGLRTILTEAWRPDDPTDQPNKVQAIRLGAFDGQDSNFDTRWLCSSNHLRGSNFMLGYTFPSRVTRFIDASSLRIFAQATNLFVVTNKDFQGYDPEGSTRGGFETGVNFFQYPRPTTFMFGVNVTF